MPDRAVFDCMIFLQAAARPDGPAAACLKLAMQGAVELVLSPDVIDEVRDVLNRPKLLAKFQSLTPELVDSFLAAVVGKATVLSDVPAFIAFSHDPKDAKYLDLAAAAQARYLVSRDNDLLALEDSESADGQALRHLAPNISIVEPVAFLRHWRPNNRNQRPIPQSPHHLRRLQRRTKREIDPCDRNQRSRSLRWFSPSPFPPRADDPLPKGAVMRLGDMRWRFAGHSEEPKRYAWLPDSSGIVACGKETIRLFDAKTGRVIRDWKGERGDFFMSVAVSPDGKTLAATKGNRIFLWDVATGKQIESFGTQPGTSLDQIAFSPDGKKIVTGSRRLSVTPAPGDDAVELWDIANAKVLRVLKLDSPVQQVGFSSADNSALVCTKTKFIRWPAAGSNPQTSITLHASGTRCANRDGTLLAVSSNDTFALLWDVNRDKQLREMKHKGLCQFGGMAFSCDSKYLWSMARNLEAKSNSDSALQFSVADGKLIKKLAISEVYYGVPLPSPDGRLLAILDESSKLDVLDVETGKRLSVANEPNDHAKAVAFSGDGQTLLSLGHLGELWLWSSSAGSPIRKIPTRHSHIISIASGVDDHSFLVGGHLPFGLRSIDARTGNETRDFGIRGSWESTILEIYVASRNRFFTRFVKSGTSKNVIVCWDSIKGEQLISGSAPNHSAGRFAGNGNIRIDWENPAGRFNDEGDDPSPLLLIFDAFEDRVLWHRRIPGNDEVSLTSSSARPIIAVTSTVVQADNHLSRGPSNLQIWDLVTGEESVRIKRPSTKIWEYFGQPLFSPNGRVIVVPWAERTLLFFDALTGKELGQLKHDVGLKPLAFTPDGKRLATGVDDGTILIWEVGKYTFRNEKRHLSPGEIEMSWRDLASAIRPAVEAMARLEESPSQALALFRERLKPAEPVSEERIQTLVKQLSDRSYARREAATRALLRLGEQVHPALRENLAAGPDAETRKRIEYLLAEPALVRSPEVRRHLRAIELTAAIATAEAKALLAVWAKGDPAARETKAAKEALERLSP